MRDQQRDKQREQLSELRSIVCERSENTIRADQFGIKITFRVYYAGHTFNSEKPNRSPVTWTTLYLSYPKSVTNPGSRMGDGWGDGRGMGRGMGGENSLKCHFCSFATRLRKN